MNIPAPLHPGEILWRDFIIPKRLTCYRLAKDLNVPVNRITAILDEERRITPETDVLLSHYFGMPVGTWLHLQAEYDAHNAKIALTARLKNLPTYQPFAMMKQ